jgi:hypothetical protein
MKSFNIEFSVQPTIEQITVIAKDINSDVNYISEFVDIINTTINIINNNWIDGKPYRGCAFYFDGKQLITTRYSDNKWKLESRDADKVNN